MWEPFKSVDDRGVQVLVSPSSPGVVEEVHCLGAVLCKDCGKIGGSGSVETKLEPVLVPDLRFAVRSDLIEQEGAVQVNWHLQIGEHVLDIDRGLLSDEI